MWLKYDNREMIKEIKRRDCIMRDLEEMKKKCRGMVDLIEDLNVDLYTDLFINKNACADSAMSDEEEEV